MKGFNFCISWYIVLSFMSCKDLSGGNEDGFDVEPISAEIFHQQFKKGGWHMVEVRDVYENDSVGWNYLDDQLYDNTRFAWWQEKIVHGMEYFSAREMRNLSDVFEGGYTYDEHNNQLIFHDGVFSQHYISADKDTMTVLFISSGKMRCRGALYEKRSAPNAKFGYYVFDHVGDDTVKKWMHRWGYKTQ